MQKAKIWFTTKSLNVRCSRIIHILMPRKVFPSLKVAKLHKVGNRNKIQDHVVSGVIVEVLSTLNKKVATQTILWLVTKNVVVQYLLMHNAFLFSTKIGTNLFLHFLMLFSLHYARPCINYKLAKILWWILCRIFQYLNIKYTNTCSVQVVQVNNNYRHKISTLNTIFIWHGC